MYNNTSGKSSSDLVLKGKAHKNAVRKDLDSLLGNIFGAGLNTTFDASPNQVRGAPAGTSGGESVENLGTSVDDGLGEVLDEFQSIQPLDESYNFIDPTIGDHSAPNNFILLALLSKLLIAAGNTLTLNMSKAGFKPYSFASKKAYDMFETLKKDPTRGYRSARNGGLWAIAAEVFDAPLQVKALSIADLLSWQEAGDKSNLGPFRDYAKSNQFYIKNGILNPLFLCYYWFIHQNLVKVEYLSEFQSSFDNVALKNKDNPYEMGKRVQIVTPNMQSPLWTKLDLATINQLATGKKLLCRLSRYDYPYYIDKKLVEALNLPLHDNYFILEGS